MPRVAQKATIEAREAGCESRLPSRAKTLVWNQNV